MNIINEVMTTIGEIIYYITTNPWFHIPIAIFIAISVILTIIRMIVIPNIISEKEESTEEDEYYKTLIECGYSSEEIDKIKEFNNEKV